jgi:C4-dicarboxylate-specific signal transduction histidine kinase
MVQVLLSLISNSFDAVEHLPEKWVHVEVSSLNNVFQISVTDSGAGIPKAVVEKIMQPFFTTKPIGKGSGLGLSVATGIAQDHHGSLKYDNTSKHTRFVLEIPSKVQLPK